MRALAALLAALVVVTPSLARAQGAEVPPREIVEPACMTMRLDFDPGEIAPLVIDATPRCPECIPCPLCPAGGYWLSDTGGRRVASLRLAVLDLRAVVRAREADLVQERARAEGYRDALQAEAAREPDCPSVITPVLLAGGAGVLLGALATIALIVHAD